MDSSPQQLRRDARGASADERPLRTKRRLTAALSEVLSAGGEVSVASVCAAAGVGRSTFYTHFTSLEDLFDFAIVSLFSDLEPVDYARRSARALGRQEITRIGLNELLEALLGNPLLVAFAVNSPAAERLRSHLVATMSASLRSAILIERPVASEEFMSITSRYIAGGVIAVVLEAVQDPGRFDRAELVSALLEVLPSWLTSDRARLD